MAETFTPPSDAAFVALFDLEHPELKGAKSAQAIVKALGARPLRAYLEEREAAALGKQIAKDDPQAAAPLRKLVELAAKHDEKHNGLASGEAYLEAVEFHHESGHYSGRGRGWYWLGQLYALTGEKRWAEQAAALLREQPSMQPVPENSGEDDFLPILPWHPNCPNVNALNVAHIVQNMTVALPMLWPGFDEAARRHAAAYLARQAEIFYRGYLTDPAYNIPFHGLVAMFGVSALFPQLKGARKWKALMDKLVGEGGPYVVPNIASQHGYLGEGLGYQQVNTFLLSRCLMLYERGIEGGRAPEPLRKEVEMAYAFAAGNVRPDGSSFLIGDHSMRCAHEHEIEYHEVLHLGAALFNRPEWKARAGGVRGTTPPVLLRFLMGAEGYARWKAMPAPDLAGRSHAHASFPDSGFFHLRAGRGVERSCHGLLNASVAMNHGHHDVLGVTIFGQGRELISDSGRLPYTTLGNALQQAPHAHAALRLGHLMPRGPRHSSIKAVTLKRFAASPDGRLQIALGEHRLIEDHVHRRALILLLPHGAEGGDGLWLVWDRLVHTDSRDGTEPPVGRTLQAPARVYETTFPLHAPGGSAQVSGLDAWSKHAPGDRLRATDKKEASAITCAMAAHAEESSESDANIQVSALPRLQPGATMDCEAQDGFIAFSEISSARPVLSFKSRGLLPFESAFALLPFRGIAEQAPWAAEGGWAGKDGSFEAVIRARDSKLLPDWKEPVKVRAEGLHGAPGTQVRIAFEVGGKNSAELTLSI